MVRFQPVKLGDSGEMKLARVYKGSAYKPNLSLVSIPRPMEGTGVAAPPLRGMAVIEWASRAALFTRRTPNASLPPSGCSCTASERSLRKTSASAALSSAPVTTPSPMMKKKIKAIITPARLP